MSALFLKILNLSINASWLILAVIILRLFLKKAPRWMSCALWAVVAFRLICPVSLETALSLLPSGEVIPQDIMTENTPMIHTQIATIDNAVNPFMVKNLAPQVGDSVNPLQVIVRIASWMWVIGAVICNLYALISYFLLKRTVRASLPAEDGVMMCDEIKTPFLLGIFKPVIYVPSFLKGRQLEVVLAHERAHIQRHDHWWKPFGFALLTVYWFHPLCWIAYILLCRDIEAACDERVIKDRDGEFATVYSQALLDLSMPRHMITICPLAFGETSVKDRVKSVLSYKKPPFWIILTGFVFSIALIVCFATNPKRNLTGADFGQPRNFDAGDVAENRRLQELMSQEGGEYFAEERWYFYEGNDVDGQEFKKGEYPIHCFIRFYPDGTMYWEDSQISSYIGMGNYRIINDEVIIADDPMLTIDGTMKQRINHFRIKGDQLIFLEKGSDHFNWVTLTDEEKFTWDKTVSPNNETSQPEISSVQNH